MTPSHAVTMNGSISTELATNSGPPEEELIRRLRLLDGVERYSLMLWRLPAGKSFDQVNLRNAPTEYIQCAGSIRGRLTVEVRQVEGGTAHQYVLGRAAIGTKESSAFESVPWNGCEARVRENEVLNATEVIELFVAYYRTGDIPGSYKRRLLVI